MHFFTLNLTSKSGTPTVRTHCSSRVSNQRSLFHISAGLDKIEPSQKEKGTTNQHVLTSQNTSPRLPPFPNPTIGLPVVQIKQVNFRFELKRLKISDRADCCKYARTQVDI